MNKKKSASILKKFLLFNFSVFSVLGLFTLLYLSAIQPSLVKQRTDQHTKIINNTTDHLKRLNIKFDNNSINNFLLSTRFLFQSLDRVQFFDLEGQILGDTNILDLDQNVFSKSDTILEENIDGTPSPEKEKSTDIFQFSNSGQESSIEDIITDTIVVISSPIHPSIFVSITEIENIPELLHNTSIEFVPIPDWIVPPIKVQLYVEPEVGKTE